MIRCNRCLKDKPDDEFRDRHRQCVTCENETQAERYARQVAQLDEERLQKITAGGDGLIAFGTAMEREVAKTLLQTGNVAATATALGMEAARVRAMLSELQRRAARSGWSPGHSMTKTVPEGFHVKGVSTYYGKDGELKGQWVKSNRDEEHKLAALMDAMSHIADAWQAKADPVAAPSHGDDELLCVYPMGDPHIGMHAWGQETGDHFDLKIAERNLCNAVDQLVAGAPEAKRALIVNVGDYFHADGNGNTTTNGTRVDVDTRWPKVLRTGIRTFRRVIDRALERHEEVEAKVLPGNHDMHSAVMLALCLEQYYEREPRVKIDTSPSRFQWYRFGDNLIVATHGDMCKMADIPLIMATDRPKDWGETKYRYGYTGHIHHDTLKEFPGCKVESFRTLAPKDKWHADMGYRSGQDMKCIVLHKRYGEIMRNTVGICQLKEL